MTYLAKETLTDVMQAEAGSTRTFNLPSFVAGHPKTITTWSLDRLLEMGDHVREAPPTPPSQAAVEW